MSLFGGVLKLLARMLSVVVVYVNSAMVINDDYCVVEAAVSLFALCTLSVHKPGSGNR